MPKWHEEADVPKREEKKELWRRKMRFSKQFKRTVLSVLAVLVFATMMIADFKPVEAYTTYDVVMLSSGESKTYSKDPSFSMEKDSSWITLKQPSMSQFTITAAANTTGKGRIGYVTIKRQGEVVNKYRVIQRVTNTLSFGPAGGNSSTYGKNSNQTVSTDYSWIKLYKPNSYNFRIDVTANTSGSARTGYVYVKEGSTIITTYKITQSATVTVTYNKNGGSGSNFTRSIAYGSNYGKVDNPTRTGYNFTGWYTAASGGTQVTATTKMDKGTNHTLYAHWSPKTFTVTFKDGSTTVSTKTVTYDSTYGDLPTRSKTGYTFNGWYTAASGGSKVTSSTKVTITANQTLYAQWSVNSYTVTYDKNGGSGSNFTRTLSYGSVYGKVDNPTRIGYDFAGWYTAASGGNQVVETTKMTTVANHTLYAHWNAKGYTVSFNSNGGSAASAKTVYYNSTYGSLPSTSRTGYTFVGWYTAASGGSQVTSSTKVTITANQTLYAHWTPKTFTVTFMDGSTTVSTKTVTYDSTYGDLPTRSMTGYTFNGWYTAASGGSKVTSSTKVTITANQTLYAQRTANSYTVTYDLNGASGSNYTRSIAYGSTYGKVGDPTRTGYEFHGWYMSKAYETQVVETTLMKTAANHTLYAKWTPKTYTVTFMDGSTRISSKNVTYDSTYGTLPSRSMTGHTFNGWYTAASGGSRIIESANVTITANQTLYAQWSVNKYTVTYDKNGGSGSNFTRSIAYGSNYGKVDNPTKTGYNFAGWFTAKSGGSEVTETTKMTRTSDHTLYAHWTPKTFTVSFSSQGGGTVFAKTVTYDSTYGTLAIPNNAGYVFAGWFTAASGGVQVKEDTKVTITANQTLYAHWTPNTLTVFFDSQGGSPALPKAVTYGDPYGDLPNPTKIGYTFEGWYTAENYGSQVTANTSATNTADHTLYAHWTANLYPVIFDSQGGSYVDPIFVSYGSTYGVLPKPIRTGYAFTGWYTAPQIGNMITADSIVKQTSGLTLYAGWVRDTTRVLIITFDPFIGLPDGTQVRQHELMQKLKDNDAIKYKYKSWSNPADLANEYAETMKNVSYGSLNYQIVETITLDEFPMDIDKNSYNKEDYYNTLVEACNAEGLNSWRDYKGWLNFSRKPNAPYDPTDPNDTEPDEFTFDYEGYFERFNVYERVNTGDIDEVWVFFGPRTGLKPNESMMTGKDAFYINGRTLVKPGYRNFATYGFNFEFTLGEMLENTGHRMERTMDLVFNEGTIISSANYRNKTYSMLNDWEKFWAHDLVTGGRITAGVGSVHCGPNARKQYDWNNNGQLIDDAEAYVPKEVFSFCDNWLNYPDLSGNSRLVNSSEWGRNIIGHHKWWLEHIPHVEGFNSESGKYNNWWWYFNFENIQGHI